ncbi:MAG TPA: hypothetical protein VL486_11150 [Verrucomicrobiae bacterium]|nr:hypothetical protein [Verrucomicrobiae bacterium]
MTQLAITSIVLGAAIIAARLPGIVAPEKFRTHARTFPRSVLWGRILIGVAAVWAGVSVYRAASDDWAWARPLIVIGVPIAYWLVIRFADQFLAVRGTAALLLLVAKVAVDAADRSDVPWRLVVTVLVYFWVCAAVWMAVAPHQLRDWIGVVTANNARCRVACSFGVAIGALLVVLGLFAY